MPMGFMIHSFWPICTLFSTPTVQFCLMAVDLPRGCARSMAAEGAVSHRCRGSTRAARRGAGTACGVLCAAAGGFQQDGPHPGAVGGGPWQARPGVHRRVPAGAAAAPRPGSRLPLSVARRVHRCSVAGTLAEQRHICSIEHQHLFGLVEAAGHCQTPALVACLLPSCPHEICCRGLEKGVRGEV